MTNKTGFINKKLDEFLSNLFFSSIYFSLSSYIVKKGWSLPRLTKYADCFRNMHSPSDSAKKKVLVLTQGRLSCCSSYFTINLEISSHFPTRFKFYYHLIVFIINHNVLSKLIVSSRFSEYSAKLSTILSISLLFR